MEHITKRFGELKANDNIAMEGIRGIHCLLGENGAGKTTLMNIPIWHRRCDIGQLYWRGQPLTLNRQDA